MFQGCAILTTPPKIFRPKSEYFSLLVSLKFPLAPEQLKQLQEKIAWKIVREILRFHPQVRPSGRATNPIHLFILSNGISEFPQLQFWGFTSLVRLT